MSKFISVIAPAVAAMSLCAASASAQCASQPHIRGTQVLSQVELPLSPDKRVVRHPCDWRTPSFSPPAGCGIRWIRVSGSGPRPAYLDIYRSADGVSETGQATVDDTPTSPGGSWHAQVNFNDNHDLNCGPGDCPTSRYSIQTSNAAPQFVCAQLVTVTFALRD